LTTAGILHSASSRRGAFSASLTEAAAAVDLVSTGLVFAVLVDDPASASDHVDALAGQLMVEVASASDTVTVSLVRFAAVVEEAAAASTTSFFGVFTYNVTVAEPATATDAPDAVASSIYNVSVAETAYATSAQQDSELPVSILTRTALVSGLEPIAVSALTATRRLSSGTMVTSPYVPITYTPTMLELAFAIAGQNAAVNGSPSDIPPG
jgi:hypothetical protein